MQRSNKKASKRLKIATEPWQGNISMTSTDGFGKYPKYTLFRLWMNETCKNRDKFWIKNRDHSSITSAKRMVGGGGCVAKC